MNSSQTRDQLFDRQKKAQRNVQQTKVTALIAKKDRDIQKENVNTNRDKRVIKRTKIS